VDQPPGQIRHSLNGGEHHFWVSSTDASTFPGHDSGPRSELRFNNNYSSGQAQFEADIKVISGTFNPCVMQIFGAATQATTFMTTHAPPARHPRPRQVSDASIPPASYRPPIDLRGGQAPAASNTTRARCAGPARATDKPGSRPKTSLGEPGQEHRDVAVADAVGAAELGEGGTKSSPCSKLTPKVRPVVSS